MYATARKENKVRPLDDYHKVDYPRERCTLRLVEFNEDIQEIAIGFPSWRDPNKVNICHYFIENRQKDFCLCDAFERYKKRCWHIKWRTIVLKAFLNRVLGDDQSWLNNIELYGARSVTTIAEYIMALLDEQEEVSQVDLLDLELVDYRGEPQDRRRIGPAFKILYDTGAIEPSRQVVAQYAKRKGGKIYVWRKAHKKEA
jgi:hypothetical protein